MPKSRKNQVVTLAQTSKKGRVLKAATIDSVRDAADSHSHVYVVSLHNERNRLLTRLRDAVPDAPLFFAKNKVVHIALGRSESEEYLPGLSKLVPVLKGKRALWFANQSVEELRAACASVAEEEYARAGSIAEKDVVLPEGPLLGVAFSLEPLLRQLGLHTKLERGVVVLLQDTPLCKVGSVLSPETCRLLKLLNIKCARFQVDFEFVWQAGSLSRLE